MRETFILQKDGYRLKMSPNVKNRYIQWQANLPDGQYEMIIRRLTHTRNTGQNALYWKRNGEIAEVTGYPAESLHEIFMQRCGYGVSIDYADGVFIRESSTQLTVDEFSTLIREQDKFVDFLNEDNENKLVLSGS